MEDLKRQNDQLQAEIIKLKKINTALMSRVEKSASATKDAFSLFEGNILLSNQIKLRVQDIQSLAKNIGLEKNRLKNILNLLPGDILLVNENGKIDLTHSKWRHGELTSEITTSFNSVFGDQIKKVISEISTRPQGYFEFDGEFNQQTIGLGTWFTRGEEKEIIMYVQDISEHKAQDKIIKMQEAQMVNASRLSSLGQMAGGIAHEINNPLTIIAGNTSLALAKINKLKIEDSERVKINEYLKKIDQTVARISKIITGLRTIARDTRGENFTPCLVANVIEDVKSLSSEKFKSHGIELSVHLHSPSIEIYGDQVQLSQVIINLLNNSFFVAKTMQEGWVHIFTKEVNNFVRIYVVDSGPGIEHEILKKIFDPFFTTKSIGEGTGLGMSISKQIIQSHQGSLEYELVDGHTGFYIEIPFIQSST